MKPIVSIIYVYYSTPDYIKKSLDSIKRGIGDIPYEIIIVDNASPKPIPNFLEIKKVSESRISDKKTKIIHNNENLGYGRAINIGVKTAKGKYLLLVNPDTSFTEGSINSLVEKMDKTPAIGIIGPQLQDRNMKVLQSINSFPFLPHAVFALSFFNKIFPNNLFSNKYYLRNLSRDMEQEVDVVGGACMLVRKSAFDKVEGFDERFFMYFEEADFCLSIKKAGFKVLYFPDAKVYHYIGKSSKDKEKIKRLFEESRFKFIRKHQGLIPSLIAEFIMRLINPSVITLLIILAVSAFLNLYKINTLMMFFGDFGRDFLAARDMLLTGKIPLVGIPSSVVWLHQGPLSIYMIGISFILGNFNPVAPAVWYGTLGVISTFFVYFIGKSMFNKYVGLLASLFFATSPLVIVNERMPYHTASIPFFSCIFLFFLYKVLKGEKQFLFLMFFFLGLLFLLELSNGVLFFLLGLLFSIYKPVFKKNEIIKSAGAFFLGISPFIIYDLRNGFKQTFGFILWVFNRVRLFFGLTVSGNSTTAQAPDALVRIWDQISAFIFPASRLVVVFIILLVIYVLWKKKIYLLDKKDSPGIIILLSWILISLLGFFIHAAPGTAYFPLIFSSLSLIIGFSFYSFFKNKQLLLPVFFSIVIFNGLFTIGNEYFLMTKNARNTMPPNNYSFGFDMTFLNGTADFIVGDAGSDSIQILPGGYISKFQTSVDNYKYLVLWKGGKVVNKSGKRYTIYQEKNEIPKKSKIIYQNKYVYVVKD